MDTHKHTILMVDDDPDILALGRFNFSQAGFRVLAAQGAKPALDYLSHEEVDLILCDISMPEMDGFDFHQQVKLDPKKRQIPFIFLTMNEEPEFEIKGLLLGVDEFIKKPFDPLVLIARVQAVLDRRKAYTLMSNYDSLTHVLNRQSMEEEIEKELERVERYRGCGCIVFVDLDNFKSVNDNYGHAVGDLVLIGFADVVKRYKRSNDIIGRYGGEEFVLYFPETSEADALAIMGRFQKKFNALTLLSPKVSCSFSAGIAEAPRDGCGFKILCERADQAMYMSKKQGKARTLPWRVEFETPEWQEKNKNGV